jgi:hypothetical protein
VYGPSISGREPIDKCLAGALRHQLNLWPDSLGPALILVVGAWWGGWLIFSSYQRYCRSVPSNEGLDTIDYHTRGLVRFLISGITQGWIWRGLLAAYACGIAASLMLAWATPAFMPYMTYGPTPDSAKQVGDLKDRFLSYAEGRWYFTHRVEAAAGEVEGYRIVGLSDSAEEAKYVRIRPHPARAARVAPFPWSEKAVTRTTQPCED